MVEKWPGKKEKQQTNFMLQTGALIFKTKRDNNGKSECLYARFSFQKCFPCSLMYKCWGVGWGEGKSNRDSRAYLTFQFFQTACPGNFCYLQK